jgi:hypothetical protein
MRTMKLPAWFPHPAAWLSAVVLLGFSRALLVAVGVVLPLLMEVARYSPRLAALGGLALWLSPVAFVASGHRVVTTVLDVRDAAAKKSAPAARVLSWWAGLYSWLVLALATSVTMFLVVAINPPPPEPDGLMRMLASDLAAATSLGVQTALWLFVAAALYHFERAARTRIASGGE